MIESVTGAGKRCERPGCAASAAGFVCVGLDLLNGRVVSAPYGYRCEEHAREGRLHEDFGEEERKRFGELFCRAFTVPQGATMFIGLTKLSPEEVEELRATFGDDIAYPIGIDVRGKS
jgi:hypothetical protein